MLDTDVVAGEAAKGPSTPSEQAAALAHDSSKTIGAYKTFNRMFLEFYRRPSLRWSYRDSRQHPIAIIASHESIDCDTTNGKA